MFVSKVLDAFQFDHENVLDKDIREILTDALTLVRNR
jgi:hypothetical protein